MSGARAVPAIAALWLAIGGAAHAGGPYPTNQCAGTRSGALGCAANDIEVVGVEVTNGVTSCVAGTTVDVGLRISLRSNAKQRYDLGIFVAKDGKPANIPVADGGSADCAVYGAPTFPPPFANFNANACGDIEQDGPAVIDLGVVTMACLPDADGNLKVPTTITWQQNANDTCRAPPAAWVDAETPSRCNALEAVDVPIDVRGRITITKLTEPAATPGAFPFTATGAAPGSFTLSDGGSATLTTGPLDSAPTFVTVGEGLVPGFDPTARITCTTVDRGNAVVIVDPATRTVRIPMQASQSRVDCTFTNRAASRLRIVKQTAGGDDTFPFVLDDEAFAITTAGGTGARDLDALAAGRYTIAEDVPDGWQLAGLSCADPGGDTTVDVASATATVNLAVAEAVTCTFTNAKSAPAAGTIRIRKATQGGDGTFGFRANVGGATMFSLATTDGVSGFNVFDAVPPGTWTVTEIVPDGWALMSIACSDPTGNSAGSGTTATIDVAAGEIVTCTFLDRRDASVAIEKRALGGDATFAFTGPVPFAITTAGGYGRDDTTFARVVPGTVFTFAETVPAGWRFGSATCIDTATQQPVGSAVPNGATFVPAAGQRVLCTVVDERLARLTVVEVSTPKSPQAFAYETTGPGLVPFTLSDDGSGANSRSFADLPPGAVHSIRQVPVADWILNRIVCDDRAALTASHRSVIDLRGSLVAVSLQPGEHLTCTFYNEQPADGAVLVRKLAEGGDAAFGYANSGGVPGSPTNPAAFTIATSNGGGSRVLAGLAAGRYTIVESVPAGWLQPAVACTALTGSNTTFEPVANGMTIELGTTGGAVDSVACAWDNVRAGRITIVEQASPDAPQAFAYAATGAGVPPGFSLVDDGSAPPADRRTFAGLAPGLFRFAVATPAGWRLTAIDCAGAAGVSTDLAQQRLDIALVAGEDVACTFRHAREATLAVTKSAAGAAPGDLFAFTAPPGLDGDYAAGQVKVAALLPGTYAVSEAVPRGFVLAGIACTGAGAVTYTGATVAPTGAFEPGDTTANVTLAAGAAGACTFTNVARSAIVVRKDTVGGDGVFAFTGVEDFQINTLQRREPEREIEVAPGTHVVRELVPAGWRLAEIACTGTAATDLASASATITVAAGERARCTFRDVRLGRIEIAKSLLGEATTAFTFSAPSSLVPGGSFVLTPAVGGLPALRVFDDVAAGSYAFSENAPPPGFGNTGVACTDPGGDSTTDLASRSALARVAAGESVACTWSNTTQARIVLDAVSFLGTDRFAFTLTNFAAPAVTIQTAPVAPEVASGSVTSQVLPPGSYGIRADPPPPGWTFLRAQCVSSSGEQHWTIDGTLIVVDLSDGEVLRCFAFYAPPAGAGGGEPLPVPALPLSASILLALALLAAGAAAARLRT